MNKPTKIHRHKITSISEDYVRSTGFLKDFVSNSEKKKQIRLERPAESARLGNALKPLPIDSPEFLDEL